MQWRHVALASLVVLACGSREAIVTPPARPVASAVVVPREEAFRMFVVADVPSWNEPRRLLVDVRGARATIVTWAPPGLRVLEGTFASGRLDVAERTTRPKVLSIVATREGDRIAGEWREGNDHHAFTSRAPPPYNTRTDVHAWSGWLGDARIRADFRVERDVRGNVLRLGSAEHALAGTVDALGQIRFEESRGDRSFGVWQGAFLDGFGLAGWRSSPGEPDELFTLAFTSSYPAEIALWNGVALAPEVYHAESSCECWADTTLFRVTGLADGSKTESLDLELARFIGVRRLGTLGCFGGSERWATLTWKKPPFAQIELDANAVEERASRCAIVDVERGHLVKVFDLVKDHAELDRFASAASRGPRCYSEADKPPPCNDVHVSAASTMCMQDDHVTVEDEHLPQTTIPKSEIARIFDVRSAIGKGIFQ